MVFVKCKVKITNIENTGQEENGQVWEQELVVEASNGQKTRVFNPDFILPLNFVGKTADAVIGVLVPKVELTEEKKKALIGDGKGYGTFIGEVIQICGEHMTDAIIDIGVGTIIVDFADRWNFKAPKLKVGDYIRVTDGRVDLHEITTIDESKPTPLKPINYPVFALTKEQREMRDNSPKEFLEWFLGIMQSRIDILIKTMASDAPELAKKMDLSPESLEMLEIWFNSHISSRKISEEELGANFPIRDWWQTEESNSLCIDAGLYYGKVIEKNVKGIEWDYWRENNAVNFKGYPLIKSKAAPMDSGPPHCISPINLFGWLAEDVVRNLSSSSSLISRFEHDKKYLESYSKFIL